MSADIKKLEKQMGYTFKNVQLLEHALTHRSFSQQHNERLEFLGDSILNFTIAAALFNTLPDVKEGELSRLRAGIVKGDSLAELALGLSLGDYLHLGSGEMKSGGFRRPSILADAVEAIIGAIYLDSGIEACQDIINKWFAYKVANAPELLGVKDAKTSLQEYLQAKQLALPHYRLLEEWGDDHQRTFIIECSVQGMNFTTEGQGPSHRKAEQVAAQAFLQALKNDDK